MSERKSKLMALAAGSLVLGTMGAAQLDASALQDYSNLGRAAQLRSGLCQGGDLVMDAQECGGSCGGKCGGGNCGNTPPTDDSGQGACGSCGQGTCGG